LLAIIVFTSVIYVVDNLVQSHLIIQLIIYISFSLLIIFVPNQGLGVHHIILDHNLVNHYDTC
jgi:hypothetical protein